MHKTIQAGDHVAWQWGQGLAQGTVDEVHFEPTSITTKDTTVSRNGSEDDPAVVVRSNKGVKVLKLLHEVQRTDTGKNT
jgi:hypothetical protein